MLSVIIPTYNAAGYLPKLLSVLQNQTIDFQLIILDSESTDDTQFILRRENIHFEVIKKEQFNHGETRNFGVSLATNEYVVFLTQDAIPASNDALELLFTSLTRNTAIAMAYGRQIPYQDTDIFGRFARYINYPDQSLLKDKSLIPKMGIKTCSCSNSFAIYKKSLLTQIGGFPSDSILGEDVTVAAKFILKDYSLAYCAEAKVFHSHSYSITDEFKRYFDIGVFHDQQKEVLRPFTNAESEGIKYVLDEIRYLVDEGAFRMIPIQLIRTVAKYFGYKIGRLHDKLPASLNQKLSMHQNFWNSSSNEY